MPYLKTVRGVPGMRIEVGEDGSIPARRRAGRPRQGACARRAPARGHRARDRPAGAFLPARRSCGFPRQPLRRDRPRAASAHPRARRRHAGHPLARAGRTAGRAGGRRSGIGVPPRSCRMRMSGPRRWRRRDEGRIPDDSCRRTAAGGRPVRGRVRERPRRARRHLAGRGTGPARPNRGAPPEDAALGRTGAAGRGSPRGRAAEGWKSPSRLPGIAPAREERSRLWDPAITVARDIRTPDGVLIAAAGTRVNPLERMTLPRDLLFVDWQARGRDRLGAGARRTRAGGPRRSCCSPAGRWS